MPRFVFSLEGHSSTPEQVAMTLDDAAEARAHSVVALGELLRSRGEGFWSSPTWRIRVTDEAGLTVCALAVDGGSDRSAGLAPHEGITAAA